jgi:transcriptional regulator with AAA-type ATPase domain
MRGGFAGEAYAAPDAVAAVELLAPLLRDGDTVLVKGSRGVGLELVAEALAGGSELLGGADSDASALARCAGEGRR